jgi:hypothetical protein
MHTEFRICLEDNTTLATVGRLSNVFGRLSIPFASRATNVPYRAATSIRQFRMHLTNYISSYLHVLLPWLLHLEDSSPRVSSAHLISKISATAFLAMAE